MSKFIKYSLNFVAGVAMIIWTVWPLIGVGPIKIAQAATGNAAVTSQPADYNTSDIFRGTSMAFAMTVFGLRDTDGPDDKLERVKVTVQGTAISAEIASLKVYQENGGNTTFEGTETLLGTQPTVNVGSATTILTSTTTLAATATLYYVVATLADTGLTGGHNFKIDMPVDSLTVSGATQATTALVGGRYATIDIGGGMMQLCVQEAMFVDPTTVDVRFSKEVNATTAQTANKYTFGGGVISGNPTSATLQPDNMTVRLVKSGATFVSTGRDTVTASSTITDLAGNPNQMTMPVYVMSGGGGGQSMAVISEVQIAGGGTASTTDEFIELYNPSNTAVDLNARGIRLHIVGADGNDSDKPLTYVSATSTIKAKGFFLITAATNYDNASTTADATYIATTTPSLENNGAVYISFATTTNSGVIDKVGWGTATVYEGSLGVNTSFSAVSWGPANNGSIERKANGGSTAVSMFTGGIDVSYGHSYDTNNNYGDFVIQATANPQNTSSAIENPGDMMGYGSGNMLPMIMHMSVMRAIKGDSTLDVAARMSDDSGTLAAANTALYYCVAGSGTACDEIGEYTAVVGSSLGSGYFKFSIPSTVRNGASVETTDIRYVLKATDPVDGTKVVYMSQNPQADMTCQSGTCDTAQIFANPFVIDVITGAQATTYGCNQTISGMMQSGGTALGDVYAFLEGTAISTTTELNGIFSFSNVCPGVFQIIGAKSGYMDAMYQASAGETGITMTMGQGFSGGGGDYSKPHVQFSMPGDMMQGFSIQNNIYVVFTKEMDATTINGISNSTAANIYLTTDGSTVVSGTMTYYPTNSGRPAGAPPDSYLMVFDPASDLAMGMNYTLVIKPNVISTNGQSLEGNKPGGGHTLNFTTFFDTTGGTFGSGANFPPYIVGTSPGNGAFNVALNAQINITFSETMNSGSINTTNIKMYTVTSPNTPSETEVVMTSPTVTLDTTGEIALVNPGVALTANKTYRVKVFGACQSAKGISMAMSTTAEMFRFNFDTGSTTDVTAPTIIGTYPSNGGTDIPVSISAINIGFSEAMDPATINANTILLKQGNTSLTATVEYDVGQRAVNILPATGLTPGGTYIIEVVAGDSGVSDIAGVHLADQSSTLAGTQNYSATFTLSTTADTDSPSIQFSRCDDFSCAITFSEPMNSAKVGETAYDSGYSVLKKTNYEIRQAPSGTTSWGGVATVGLTAAMLEYDQINNTVKITGLSLAHSGQDFQVKVSNAGDRFINASNYTVHQIGGGTGWATFAGPIQDSLMTGGMMGPGGPGPMMVPTISGGTATMGGSGGFDYGGNWEKPTNVMPMNMTASQSTTYFVEFPATQAIPAGGSIKLTFPTGTDVASAQLVSEAQSMMNKDINGPAAGTVKIAATESSGGAVNDGISVSVSSRMITATIDASNSASQAGDMIRFDIKGVVNPTVARSFDTNGYTVDIKTFNALGTLLDSMTSFPFFINAAGAYTLSGTITAASASTGTARIYLGSPMTGPNETTVSFTAATTSYSFTGLSAGNYYLNTEPTITLGTTDYTGYVTPDPVFVNDTNCPGSTCTKNFSFTKQDNSSAYELTVKIVGDFRTVSGISATDRNIDIFASSPSGFAVKTVSLADANYTAGSPYSTKIYLSAVGNWSVGFGPAMPKGTMMMGPPPMPSWMPPSNIEVGVSGTFGAPGWTETSGTSNNDGILVFTVTNATNQIVGYVADTSGNAIANVDVEAHRTQGNFGMPAHSQTDANGKFTLKVSTGMYEVNAWMPGMPWAPGQNVNVVADTSNVGTDGNSTADVYKNNGTTLVKDTVSGYNPASPETEFLVTLNKSATTISGKLLDDSGNPVANGPVWAYNQSTGEHMPSGTDSSGNYTIYVGNGNWVVNAFVPGIGEISYANNPVNVSGSSKSDIIIRPVTGASFSTISGTVTMAGAVVANANIWVDRSTYHNNTNTNSSGIYSLKVPAAAGYTVHVWMSDYGELTPVTVNASSNVTQNFTVAAGSVKTLTFSFANYNNVAASTEAFLDVFIPAAATRKGNNVRITDLSTTATTSLKMNTGSGYEMHMFVPGIGSLSPTCANVSGAACTAGTGGGPDTWSVSGDATIPFVVPDTSSLYTLTITVKDGSNAVVRDAFVWLNNNTVGLNTGSPTNSSGVATVKIPTGTYKLGVDKPGYTGPAPIVFTPSTDAGCTGLTCSKNLALASNPYTLSGQITGTGLLAIANAWVWAEKVTSATDLAFAGGWTGASSDANGNYTLSISNGYWLVHSVADGYQETIYQVSGARTSIQINGASQTSKNIALVVRSGYSAIQPKSAPVTPASGGTIDDSSNTGVKLIIPPAALGTDTSAGTVSIQDTFSVPNTSSATPLGGSGINITATNSSGQAVTSLSGSATMEISYLTSDLPTGVSESQLMLVYFDDTSNQWVEVASSQDTTNHEFSGSITHFTTYAVAYTADVTGPTTPSSLSGVVGSTSAVLSWTASTDNETSVDGYEITRSTDGTNFSTIGSTDPWSTGVYVPIVLVSGITYTDSNLTPGTRYYYQIIAYDTAGNHSASSASLTVDTSSSAGGGTPTSFYAAADVKKTAKLAETPASTGVLTEGSLVKVADSGKVYVIKGTQRVWIPTAQAFEAAGYQWLNIQTVSAADLATATEAQLIKAADSPKVYVLVNGLRRHIPTATVFESYNYNWTDIATISQAETNGYPEVNLLKLADDPKVYVIGNGLRRHIPTATVFESYGYKWAEIVTVNATEMNAYGEAQLIKGLGNVKVYQIINGKRHHIGAPAIFNAHGWKWEEIMEVNDTELATYPEDAAITE